MNPSGSGNEGNKSIFGGLTEEEVEVYARQIVLDGIGYEGQVRLKNSKVCIVGLGGLGSSSALELTAMGVGTLRLVDGDVVARSDLHRQHLYDTDLLGYAKVEAASIKLGKLNPLVKLEPIPAFLTQGNALEMVGGCDLVLDGLDSIEARYILNRACIKLGIPYIFAGAIEHLGNLSTIIPGETPCLECFYQGIRDEVLPTCAVVGVHPSVLDVVTGIQVAEAVRILTGREPHFKGKILMVDLEGMSFDEIPILRQETCPVCGEKPLGPPPPLTDYVYRETCARDGRGTYIISPPKRMDVDLGRLVSHLSSKGFKVKVKGIYGVTLERDGIILSILKAGIMIYQEPRPEPGPKKRIIALYNSIMEEALGLSPDILTS